MNRPRGASRPAASLLRIAATLVLGLGLAPTPEAHAQLENASIGDYVWLDQDADGVQDAAEAGIPNVIVYLDLDNNDIRHPHEPFATTDANGAYDFTSLAAGTYFVRIDRKTIPSGYELTTANIPLTVVLAESDDYNGADFGYDDDAENASIGDYVWYDQDGDGVQDATETGIPGVTVYLDLNASGTLDTGDLTRTTDAGGAYDFTGLAAATYSVRVDAGTVLAGYDLTTANIPLSVALAESQDYNDADFGYDDDAENASIGDYTWYDQNADGVQDDSEPGIPGVTVFLDLDDDGIFDPGEPFDATDVAGAYDITGLAAGAYSVRIDAGTVPAGYSLTTDNIPLTVILAESQDYNNADFGYDGDAQNASIGDYVWFDQDGDGVQDAAETGIPGVTIYLDTNGSALLDPGEPFDATDVAGAYDITGLAAGTYSVRVDAGTVPAGYSLTTDNIPLTVILAESQDYNNADFGYDDDAEDASIGDYVWFDQDGDGVQDGTETGLPAVTVYLDLNASGTLDAGDLAQTTDASGAYDFGGLAAATYSVRVDASTIPGGYSLTTANIPLTVVLAESQDYNNADFGYDAEPGFSVNPEALTVAEPNGDGTFTISLTTQPADTVTIGLAASNSECTVAPASLQLTPANWQTGDTATVTAVDDPLIDGSQTCTIQTAPVVSSDTAYSGQNPPDVTVTVTDDDGAGFALSATTLNVSEPDGQATFNISLTTRPSSSVYFPVSTSHDECTASPSYIRIMPDDWDTGATVSVYAVDDDIDDGTQTCLVQTGTALSDDPSYYGLDPGDVTVYVQDDDVAGFDVAPGSLTVSEPSGSAVFAISLTSQPVSSVIIPLRPTSNQCTVSPTSVSLGASNWDTGVIATVYAVDDDVQDGSQTCVVETESAGSDDPNYDLLNPPDVTVTVLDNDTAGIQVIPTSLAISEPDGADAFTVILNTQPTAEVSFDLSVSNEECSIAPDRVVLNAANWDEGVVVTVTAVDDDLDDDLQTCMVQTSFTSSADGNYDGLNPQDVTVAVDDDDATYWIYLPMVFLKWPPIPSMPSLNPIDNADGNGSYAVAWTASSDADTYVLQEATNSAFSNAITAYSGPATSYDVTGRGAARYYYRVKARNIWNESGWSNIRQVDVLWEAESNDTYAQANGPIVPSLVYYGTFPSGDDVDDYYFFDLPAAHTVKVWLTNIPVGQNYNLVLRDADLAVVGYSAQAGNTSEYIETIQDLDAGRYYIQIYHFSTGGSTEPYHLRFALE